MSTRPSLPDESLAYLTLRVALGVDFLVHGLVRLPNLNGFANGMATRFETTWLPGPLVYAFGLALPIYELVVGLAILLGWQTRLALVGAAFLMSALIFGSGLLQDWGAVNVQLVHAVALFIALYCRRWNRWCLDRPTHT